MMGYAGEEDKVQRRQSNGGDRAFPNQRPPDPNGNIGADT